MSEESLLEKIYDLQEKLTFCEDMLHSLNEVVARQDIEIGKLWDANRLLKQQLKEARDPDSQLPEPPPPHY